MLRNGKSHKYSFTLIVIVQHIHAICHELIF